MTTKEEAIRQADEALESAMGRFKQLPPDAFSNARKKPSKTSAEALQLAERRGYAKGYFAGMSRKVKDTAIDRKSIQRQAMLDRLFAAALTACIGAQGWNDGNGSQISSLPERVKLAKQFATEAMRQRPMGYEE